MSRKPYHFTPNSRKDLREVATYIRKDSRRAANAVVARIREVCQSTIAMFPECGTMRDDLLPGMRCFAVGNYVIFFRSKNPVQLLRIIHGAQDVSSLDFSV